MEPQRNILATAALLLLTALLPASVLASPQEMHIVDTPHNLSVTGGRGGAHGVKSNDETRICIFCHTPHHASSEGPLWSRKSNLTMYVPYFSTTINAIPGQPQGVSRLCLSCHDGAIALGVLLRDYKISDLGKMPAPDPDPAKNSNFGNNLSTSHPISMDYGLSPELHDKSTLGAKGIALAEDTFVECTSCHDPHNNQYDNFLVRDTYAQHDALCTDCHNKDGWTYDDSAHKTGGTRYAEGVTSQVETDGCRSCHLPHTAQRGVHLLKQETTAAGEESNCVSVCHKGASYTTVAGDLDIATQMARTYTHPVQNYPGIHTPNENLPLTEAGKHVQCVDCHNPHRAGFEGSPLGATSPSVMPASVAPAVNGPLRGVRGLDMLGNQIPGDGLARYEYEICFKCHGSPEGDKFNSGSALKPNRVFSDYNQSKRFGLLSPSYHPVTRDTVGRTGRSLVTGFQNTQFRIYCSDCHAPHGSNEPHILRAQNLDTFPSAATSYPLCYRCHEELFLNPASPTHSSAAALHQSHVRDHGAPCAACHDPHGVPPSIGANTTTAAHLVNFDTRYAGATAQYNSGSRSCMVTGTCHVTAAPNQTY